KKNPEPYREQILTYSTALALTGRSAACAPPMARRPAAEPRTRLLIVFMLNLQVALKGRFRIRWVRHPKVGSLVPSSPLSRFAPSDTPAEREGLKRTTYTGRPRDAPLRRVVNKNDQFRSRNRRRPFPAMAGLLFRHLLQK